MFAGRRGTVSPKFESKRSGGGTGYRFVTKWGLGYRLRCLDTVWIPFEVVGYRLRCLDTVWIPFGYRLRCLDTVWGTRIPFVYRFRYCTRIPFGLRFRYWIPFRGVGEGTV